MAVDSSGNLYAANAGSVNGGIDLVTVYGPAAAAMPPRIDTIGSDSGMEAPTGIALDPAGKIYVANAGSAYGGTDSITVYPYDSFADEAPSKTISGANTGLALPEGLAVDGDGILYAANGTGGPDGMGSVTIYPYRSNGNVTPTATISGGDAGDNTGFNFPAAVAVDTAGNIYVANAASEARRHRQRDHLPAAGLDGDAQ